MSSKNICLTELDYFSSKIPAEFSEYRILHISDLHGQLFGKNQKHIVETIGNKNPNLIFITGDIIDRNRNNISAALALVRGVLQIAPVYFVTGNHEWESGSKGTKLMRAMKNMGVQILHDEICRLKKKNDVIQIAGIDDPFMLSGKKTIPFNRISSENFMERFIDLTKLKEKGFSILLSHRPEFFHFYKKAQFDLVFSGHAHGGQIRIPGIGGVLSPHQGFFPKYTEGMSCFGNTCMVVSRGLGNSCFPLRINNSPELILVTLKQKIMQR